MSDESPIGSTPEPEAGVGAAPPGRGLRRAALSVVVAGGLVLLGLGLTGIGELNGRLERAAQEAQPAEPAADYPATVPVGFYGPSLAERRNCAPPPARTVAL